MALYVLKSKYLPFFLPSGRRLFYASAKIMLDTFLKCAFILLLSSVVSDVSPKLYFGKWQPGRLAPDVRT